jgi:DNA (cytosine-5)-methyltransferase 1
MASDDNILGKFRIADLFCGAGGLGLGFQQAGFRVVLGLDNWKDAARIYSQNFPHEVVVHDLGKVEDNVDILKSRHVNAIVGGPPCQDFSHAGKREEGVRADLTEAFARTVVKCEAEFFVMENVERAKNSRTYKKAKNLFENAGYGLTEAVLDASLCGVPQKRKRFFCIGISGGSGGELSDILENRLSEKAMTMRDYFGNTLHTDYYYRHPRNYTRRAIYSMDEPSATIRGVNRPIPSTYKKHPNDAGEVSAARMLSTQERAMIQTFPSDFKWSGSKTQIEQMVGNAVPVNLAKFVAEALSCFLKNTSGDGNGLRCNTSLV